jgi:hypothetical protein
MIRIVITQEEHTDSKYCNKQCTAKLEEMFSPIKLKVSVFLLFGWFSLSENVVGRRYKHQPNVKTVSLLNMGSNS